MRSLKLLSCRYLVALMSVLVLSLPSCELVDPCGATAEAFVSRTDDFFAQVGEADYAASSNKWEVYDERLRQLVEECYPTHEQALSAAEDRQFWAGVGKYYVRRYGRAGAREALKSVGGGVSKGLRKVDRWLNDNL